MLNVCEYYCAPFLRTNRVTVEFNKLYKNTYIYYYLECHLGCLFECQHLKLIMCSDAFKEARLNDQDKLSTIECRTCLDPYCELIKQWLKYDLLLFVRL